MKKIFLYISFSLITLCIIAQSPKNYYLLGVSKSILEEEDSAIFYFDKAIALDPGKSNYYLHRGNAYYENNNFEKAIADFQQANELDNNIADLWIAKCCAKIGDKKLSVEYLKKHLKSKYRIPEHEIKSDDAFDQLQYSDDWFNLWQNDWYCNEEKLEKEINYLIKKELYFDALSLIDEKLNGSEKPEILYTYRAKIHSMQGNNKAALMDWNEVIGREKYNPVFFKERGMEYFKAGKFKESVDDFSKAIHYNPADFSLYIQRAKAYCEMKLLEPAIQDMETYLIYFPEDQSAIAMCGELNFANQNYINALKCFNKNIASDNSNPAYFKARGKTYLQTGMNKYAINDLSMALDLSPNDGETYFYKGLARFQSGDREGACDDWKKALKLGEIKAMKQLLDHCQ